MHEVKFNAETKAWSESMNERQCMEFQPPAKHLKIQFQIEI